ncbi:TetR/AcrR family transcriptional regulator [Micromonospora sp. NBC_01813]|uniref:TetR/AcrR family transcriptional regulator n=1 Tax=Micromonospora sp. NBC_01813 TaxID=2975988 RepID=UPI002DDC83A7|nr:TetR family transcriptional regulator [Micromonospora sp. NBC_01813]WSA07665.1 TetR family transcriptional regulator [Micromonospora sp. NBC_01813]
MSPRPPASERLDRDEVLSTALAIADADGLDAVTLRRVAAAWNVTPMALYWHFKDKDALLDALVERILGELDLTASDEADLRTVLTALLRVLRAHPALAEITPIRLMRTDAGIDLAERVVALLRTDGHSPVAAAQLSIILLNALIGLVIRQPGDPAATDPALRESLLTAKRARLKSLPPQDYPHLTETADFFLGLPDEQEYYERGLTMLLDGVRPT